MMIENENLSTLKVNRADGTVPAFTAIGTSAASDGELKRGDGCRLLCSCEAWLDRPWLRTVLECAVMAPAGSACDSEHRQREGAAVGCSA